MSKAAVLLSGGLDSCVCTALAVKEFGAKNVIAVTLFYGQKHAVEIKAAKTVAQALGVEKHYVKRLPDVFSGSALTDSDKAVPDLSYEELAKQEGPSPNYVPNRNMNFLAVATTIAMVEGAGYLYFGAHAEDAQNWAYSDTTPEFIGAMAAAIYVSSYHKVRLVTPLQWLLKKDIVLLAYGLKAPLQFTHSCYKGSTPACGTCATCTSRLYAFKKAGLVDPIEYQKLPSPEFWRGCTPFTQGV